MKQHYHLKVSDHHPYPGFKGSYSSELKPETKTALEHRGNSHTNQNKAATNSKLKNSATNLFVFGDEDSDEQTLYFKRND